MESYSIGIIFIFAIILAILVIYTLTHDSNVKSDPHPTLDKITERLSVINPEFSKIPLKLGHTGSFTENKKVITLCLQDPASGKEYNMDILMYVTLHEVAHILTKSIGHTEEFKQNFAKLLKLAIKYGVYNPEIQVPENYCGLEKK